MTTAYLIDAAGYVIGTCDAIGAPAGSVTIPPPANARHPLRFLNGAWLVPTASQSDTRITRLAFLNRMTLQERVAIRSAAQTDKVIEDIVDLLSASTWIDLARQDLIDSVEYLRVRTLLTSPRKDEILNNPIEDVERPVA